MLEYIYVCRHGFRSNWIDPSIKTSPTGMPRDPPLAAYGTAQAKRLASWISSPDSLHPHPVPERVFSSPFYRCIETASPCVTALKANGHTKEDMALEHGVAEWYSPVNPGTGLHPRPGSPSDLATFFPDLIDTAYSSTVYPSRRGESLRDLHDRAELFVEAWTSRVEEMGYRVVVVFAHAASVIVIGRALTGDKTLEVPAGCASVSLYKRKAATATTSPPGRQAEPARDSHGVSPDYCGVGQWDPVFLGRADHLENGLERDWSFRDVVLVDGEVITDDGDHRPHPPEEAIPEGLADGMDKYLRRGRPRPTASDPPLELKTAKM